MTEEMVTLERPRFWKRVLQRLQGWLMRVKAWRERPSSWHIEVSFSITVRTTEETPRDEGRFSIALRTSRDTPRVEG